MDRKYPHPLYRSYSLSEHVCELLHLSAMYLDIDLDALYIEDSLKDESIADENYGGWPVTNGSRLVFPKSGLEEGRSE